MLCKMLPDARRMAWDFAANTGCHTPIDAYVVSFLDSKIGFVIEDVMLAPLAPATGTGSGIIREVISSGKNES